MASPHVATKVPVGQVNGDFEHCDTSSSRPIQHCSILKKALNSASCRLSCAQWCPVCQNRIQSEYSVTGIITPGFFPEDHQPSSSNSVRNGHHLDFVQYEYKKVPDGSPPKRRPEVHLPSSGNCRTGGNFSQSISNCNSSKGQCAKHIPTSFDGLHDNYLKEVEVLRGKLKELQGSINRTYCLTNLETNKDCGDGKVRPDTICNTPSPLKSKVANILYQNEPSKAGSCLDGKRTRQLSDSESNILPIIETISKKARDISPVTKKSDIPHAQRSSYVRGSPTGDHLRNSEPANSNVKGFVLSQKSVPPKPVPRSPSPLCLFKQPEVHILRSSPPKELPRTDPPKVVSVPAAPPTVTLPKPIRNSDTTVKGNVAPPPVVNKKSLSRPKVKCFIQCEDYNSVDLVKTGYRKGITFSSKRPPRRNSDESIEDKDSEESSECSTVTSWDDWATARAEISFPKPTISDAVLRILKERFPDLHPCLRSSLFSHVPPYVKFYTHDTKADQQLPLPIQKILKWKLTLITPVVVRKTVANSGFKLVRKSNDWHGSWGKHMKSVCFKTLRENQKLNHFPGTFQIGRKDRLWENLYRMMGRFGKKEFGFIPRTFVLPKDSKALRDAWDENETGSRWIVKPPACARGTGIKVIHKWSQIPKRAPIIVQKYISNPYLINGNKFDLRLYVLVTSFNPLRVYLYDNGLVRFASVKYSDDLGSLSDRYMHLTNYSINKLSNNYTQNEDAEACMGHKWTVRSLWNYLEGSVDVKALWNRLADLVIKTMISGDTQISQLTRSNLNSRYCSYELFGVDVLLDENLNPWLLEVNISPSLHSASPLDLAVKGPMVQDLMNIAGYHIPNKLSPALEVEFAPKMGVTELPLTYDPRMYVMGLSYEEKKKHAQFFKIRNREQYLESIIEDLTPDDVRHLIQYEDEFTQCGNFQKIFPTPDTYSYHKFFKGRQYYYNKLFDAWENKYHNCRDEGIKVLQSYCLRKAHLDVTNVQNRSASSFVNEENILCEEILSTESSSSSIASKSSSLRQGDRLPRIKASKVGYVVRPYSRAAAIIARRKARKQRLLGIQQPKVQLDAQGTVTL